ncbi:hypothetical protein AAFF_G00325940 [Aldrovandia affinis]|uniref:Cation/H+ exchanger transmembrane domain-containing protein n=1 Tax=Aldrovandia affinis TaxID=143900 RepID=A0AAD7T979_9TELE|nr:hypothetical protein AAFF_G00325940 [Aldrovandia affinis]
MWRPTVSQKSNNTIKYFLKLWSSVSETLTFIFLVAGIPLLMAVVNKLRRNAVTPRDQFAISYGGLRGEICFSLVFLIDGFPKKRLFITATIVIFLFTVFVQGMTIKPLVELMEVKRRNRAPPTVSETGGTAQCWSRLPTILPTAYPL